MAIIFSTSVLLYQPQEIIALYFTMGRNCRKKEMPLHSSVLNSDEDIFILTTSGVGLRLKCEKTLNKLLFSLTSGSAQHNLCLGMCQLGVCCAPHDPPCGRVAEPVWAWSMGAGWTLIWPAGPSWAMPD